MMPMILRCPTGSIEMTVASGNKDGRVRLSCSDGQQYSYLYREKYI